MQQSLRLAAPPHSEPKVLLCGSADDTRKRTWFEITAVMGMPLMCGRAKPFIVSPIAYPQDYLAAIAARPDQKAIPVNTDKHSVQIALEWKRMLTDDKTLTKAKIARNEGVSRARVTQIMNLLHLAPAIISHIRALTAPKDLCRYSERRLRQLLCLPSASDQLREFRRLQHQSAT